MAKLLVESLAGGLRRELVRWLMEVMMQAVKSSRGARDACLAYGLVRCVENALMDCIVEALEGGHGLCGARLAHLVHLAHVVHRLTDVLGGVSHGRRGVVGVGLQTD